MRVNEYVQSELVRTKNEALWSRNIDAVKAWQTNQNVIEMNLDFMAMDLEKVLDQIEKSKVEKVGEWLLQQSEKKQKEAALLIEMARYQLELFCQMKQKSYV